MTSTLKTDVAVIGLGIYGRYVAQKLDEAGINVILIGEDDASNFNQSSRGVASLVNQARIHNGYHYPRSFSTAIDSVNHYQQFIDDFKDAVIDNFKQVYAISKHSSLTNSSQFEKFCKTLGVKCETYQPSFLNINGIDKSWLTDEVAIDTRKMMKIMINRTNHLKQINEKVIDLVEKESNLYRISTKSFNIECTSIINCSYSGINEIEKFVTTDKLTRTKFELCEIALFSLPENIERIGLTVMDGPFVSFMPFTNDTWSLTSVVDTPHLTSTNLNDLPDVRTTNSKYDTIKQRLSMFVNQSLLESMTYIESKYVIKTISSNAENDDNRLIHVNHVKPNFMSVLSGKLNAIYELDNILTDFIKENYE